MRKISGLVCLVTVFAIAPARLQAQSLPSDPYVLFANNLLIARGGTILVPCPGCDDGLGMGYTYVSPTNATRGQQTMESLTNPLPAGPK